MEMLIPRRKRLAGFTLIEMAIVIALAAILLSAGLSLLLIRAAAAQLDVTQKHQEAIKQALINYLGKNLRLPCPADSNSSGGEVRDPPPPLLPPCVSYSGIVPYQTLGLDRVVALDGWGNFITYVVSPNPIATPPASPLTTAWLYTYTSTAPTDTRRQIQTPASSAFWPSTSTGGIKVTDGSNPIADPAAATGAAVVLISYGKNGYGAYNVKGLNDATPAGTDEQVNVSPVSGVLPTVTLAAVKRDTSDSPAGNAFDDVVMILSANDLTGPLIVSGTLQSSAQAALSQANDILLGNVVASKSLCSSPCPSSTNYYYTIPAPGIPSFPPNVSAWGATYVPSASAVDITSTSGVAYTLTAGDGTSKMVSIQELQGILGRAAGF